MSTPAGSRSQPPRFDVVCIGLATLDTILVSPSHPVPDGRIVVPPFVRADGGPAATAAVAAARLGARTAFVGVLSDDATGASQLRRLQEEDIDVTGVERRTGPVAESVVLVDGSQGTRSILHAPGVALESLSVRAREIVEHAAWIHVDHEGHRSAADVAPERLSVDDGNPIPDLALRGLGLYGPSRSALAIRTGTRSLGAGVRWILAAGAQRVVVTAGRDGAVAADAGGWWSVEAAPAEVASTLGAGDVFHGAMVASISQGHPLPEALRRANLAAALACRGVDGRASAPRLDELESLLASSPKAVPMSESETP